MLVGVMQFIEAYLSDFRSLVSDGAQLKKIAGGFGFLEGPCWFGDRRSLVFSDIPGNTMYEWRPDSGVSVFRNPSGFANGNTRDNEGRLLTCHHVYRSVTRTESDGSVETLVERYNGGRLNSPNDIIVSRDGRIWFTDPTYGIAGNDHGVKAVSEQQHNNVFCLNPGGELRSVISDFDMPNGLAFSPDEQRLYVSDTGRPCHIRVFDMESGLPASGQVFAEVSPGVPDGFRVDTHGNVWTSAGDGVHCYSPAGELLGKILVPESPANLEFGGPNGTTLFITARTSLYMVELCVRGACTQRRTR